MTENRKVTQGKKTSLRLVKIARRHFHKKGYAATSTQEIIQQAGVTKGALYHHFPSKVDLFEAVYRQVEDEMAEKINQASAKRRDPFEQFLSGCNAYLESCLDDSLHRILRQEGPSVLGTSRWQAIDREYGIERLLPFLQSLNHSGVIKVRSVEAFAVLVTGAMNEATFWCAGHPEPARALKESKIALRELLMSVRGNPGSNAKG